MAFDLHAAILAGYRFDLDGPQVSVIAPDGAQGAGASPEEAIANIGAQILPVEREDYVGRVLIRASGEEIRLDAHGVVAPVVDADAVVDSEAE